MRFLHFLLSHSLFIALCATALCFQTALLLHVPLDYYFLSFIFFTALGSYNVYWLLSKYYFSSRNFDRAFLQRNVRFLLIIIISAACALYCLAFLQSYLILFLPAALLTFIYSLPLWPFPFSRRLQQAGLFKTIVLALAWAYVTVVPIAFQQTDSITPMLLLFTARFFFMLVLCLIFDLRDMAVDKIHGLHSMATDLGRKRSIVIVSSAFLIYLCCGVILRYYFLDNVQTIAFLFTAAAVWVVYRLSLQQRTYFFYYFITDGMMILSAGTTWLAFYLQQRFP